MALNFVTCLEHEYAIALSLLIAPSCLRWSFALTSSTVPGMSHHPCCQIFRHPSIVETTNNILLCTYKAWKTNISYLSLLGGISLVAIFVQKFLCCLLFRGHYSWPCPHSLLDSYKSLHASQCHSSLLPHLPSTEYSLNPHHCSQRPQSPSCLQLFNNFQIIKPK